jgi:hypothetical protein
MKKLLVMSSAVAISLSLAGCHTMNDTANFANSTVGTGVKYTATAVGTGVGFVGNGVGTVVNTGVGFFGGHPKGYNSTRYTNTHAVYHHNNKHYYNSHYVKHNGHQYKMKNGKYVRID